MRSSTGFAVRRLLFGGAKASCLLAVAACGSNTGSLELFGPAGQPGGAASGSGGLGNDGAVMRSANGGGSTAADSGPLARGGSGSVACNTDRDCNGDNASRCEPQTHTCVECTASSDCSSGDRPICDGVNHTCVECASDADCRDSSKPGCLRGRCQECSSSAQCSSGQTCNTSDGHCA